MNSPLNRRQFLETASCAASLPFLLPPREARAETVPDSIHALWADFDPRKEPLETEVIREWIENGAVYRYVRYRIGTFKGTAARMAALYGFPSLKGSAPKKLPAVLHIHGGGQRASLGEVKFLVNLGYAALSVNWGGWGGASSGSSHFNAPEGAQPGEPNTEWGSIDPTQLNAERYRSILPGPKQIEEKNQHPKNCNWYALTVGCRRGLTFLEQQPEVDPERLGVHGYSMGGNLTMYVAGTDSRVKAAVPSVGGQGWRWEKHEFIGGTTTQEPVEGDLELFRKTLSFESYAPLIRCPVMHRSSTNDFHGWMDDVYRTNALIPQQITAYSWTPHLNHKLSPEVAVTLPLWMNHFLKGGPALPQTPKTELDLQQTNKIPLLRLHNAHSWPVARCEIFYSSDPDPRARFWRSANVRTEGNAFSAQLPVHSTETALFAFANLYYKLPEPISLEALPGFPKLVHEVCISSGFHSVTPSTLKSAGIQSTLLPTALIQDFSKRLQDWFIVNESHPSLRQLWTRKVTDPVWKGPDKAKLQITLRIAEQNTLAFALVENEWRNYRGQRKIYVCERTFAGSADNQQVTLTHSDFIEVDTAKSLQSWAQIDRLGLCAAFYEGKIKPPTRNWKGSAAEFLRLEWIPA